MDLDLDRKQLETIDVISWRTTGGIWNLLGIIVVSYFQRIYFQPEQTNKNYYTVGRILAREVVGSFMGLCRRVSESLLLAG